MSDILWGKFEELRPDQLEDIVAKNPVVYWPLGLIEHHGWALPVGFDGVKAQRYCERLASKSGGAVLPVMWWGSGGGHQDFKWTFYQDREAGTIILKDTVSKLIDFGFKAVVIFAGHYPWDGPMDSALPEIAEKHPEVLMIWGKECNIGGPDLTLPGDHASRWETAYGLALLPELVDMDALRDGRDDSAWPLSGPPPENDRHPGVEFDTSKRRFAQLGEDPSLASAEEAEAYLAQLEENILTRIQEHLSR